MGDMNRDDPPDTEAAMKALLELFSDPRSRSPARFRYPIEGPTEVEQAFDAAMKEAFGPDESYERWVRRLRRLGLIGRR
jgi:hypothetical protein